jgi:hypothetical protein
VNYSANDFSQLVEHKDINDVGRFSGDHLMPAMVRHGDLDFLDGSRTT